MSALKFIIIVPALLALAACVGKSSDSSTSNAISTTSTSSNSCGAISTGSILIDGLVTFQRVPHNGYGLDYTATFNAPARSVMVQAFDTDTNSLVATGNTDSSGNYSLNVPNNTNIKIRVVAQMVKTGSLPNWNFNVKDNTNGNAVYVMDGSSACDGTSNETRNLTALSGWNATLNSYTNTRTAAPFAILDTVYEGIQLISGANATLNFPALNLYWSPNNTDATIGTTYFDGNNSIYILGDQNVDTDEYDPSVIAHEWGHYIEAHFSRSDSIGGSHSNGDYLDMRLAFGEGFGNAFSSMVRNDPVYADSNGKQQSSGFGFNVETETVSDPGWYSESSVEKILYDLYDSNNDSADSDTLSLGFMPIWDVLTNEERSEPVFTGIFKFITALKSRNPGDAGAIDSLVNAQNIHVTNQYGDGETNNTNKNISDVLPIFDSVTTTSPANKVCVTNAFRRGLGAYDYNVLGMNHYIRFTPPSTGNYKFTISMSTSSDSKSGDPDAIFYNDNAVHIYNTSTPDKEIFVETLNTAREYMLEFNDYQLLTNTTSTVSHCYTVSVTQQ